MRPISPAPFTVYLFDALPTDKAKEKARDWWRECEAQDPAWLDEWRDSTEAARAFVRSYNRADTLADMFATVKALRAENTPDSRCCPWTGFCAE